MTSRPFRTDESLEAEQTTRKMIPEFLLSKGFREVKNNHRLAGTSVSQTIAAVTPSGKRLTMRVKLCWRTSPAKRNPYSAAQLFARVRTGRWEDEIQAFAERAQADNVTHFLFIQRQGGEITQAALVPTKDMVAIWSAQRDISQRLIDEGKLGRRRKNHAMNGSSPTIWLRDSVAPEVARVLWQHPGVQDLTTRRHDDSGDMDDTYADIGGLDFSLLGSDGSQRSEGRRSFVARHPRVRRAVFERANGKCERCEESRSYTAFLDVHHILGAEASDRVWTCVAICPNCHRDTHFSPQSKEINAALLDWADQFRCET